MIALGAWCPAPRTMNGRVRKHILCLIVEPNKALHHQAKNNKFYANGIEKEKWLTKNLNEFFADRGK